MTERINQTAFDKLCNFFTGKILLPEEPSYEQFRSFFYAMINKKTDMTGFLFTVIVWQHLQTGFEKSEN